MRRGPARSPRSRAWGVGVGGADPAAARGSGGAVRVRAGPGPAPPPGPSAGGGPRTAAAGRAGRDPHALGAAEGPGLRSGAEPSPVLRCARLAAAERLGRGPPVRRGEAAPSQRCRALAWRWRPEPPRHRPRALLGLFSVSSEGRALVTLTRSGVLCRLVSSQRKEQKRGCVAWCPAASIYSVVFLTAGFRQLFSGPRVSGGDNVGALRTPLARAVTPELPITSSITEACELSLWFLERFSNVHQASAFFLSGGVPSLVVVTPAEFFS